MNGCKISPVAFGLSLGVLSGIVVLIMGLLATHYAYGHEFVTSMGTVYPGYKMTIPGSLLGGLIAFIHSFIMGALIAWLYNCFNDCACLCCNDVKKPPMKRRKLK